MKIQTSDCEEPLFTLTLDKPPSWNSVYKISRYGDMYMTKEGRLWKTLAIAHAKTSRHCLKLDTLQGKVFIVYKLYLTSAERSDIDNRLKLTNDILEASGILSNDNRIFGTLITKHQCPRLSLIHI